MASDKPDHWVRDSIITGIGAALFTVFVLLANSYLVSIAVVVGVVTFLYLVTHNPNRWAIRMMGGILGLLGSTQLVPTVVGKVDSSTYSAVGAFINEHSATTPLCLSLIFVSLLVYEILRGEYLLPYLATISAASRTQATSPQDVLIEGGSRSPVITQAAPGSSVSSTVIQEAVASRDINVYTAPTTAPTANSEVDACVAYLREGKPQIAIELLAALQRNAWDRLDSRARYRVHANLGNAYEALERFSEAARQFIAAKAFQPLDETARGMEAAAYVLLGDYARAHDLAKDVLREFPVSIVAWAVYIRSAPAEMTVAKLKEEVPLAVRSTIEILDALAHRATQEGEFRLAENYSREAADQLPENQILKQRLAVTLLRPFCDNNDTDDIDPSLDELDRRALNEAVGLLTDCISAHRESGNIAGVARTRMNRGAAYRRLGMVAEATDDYQEACTLAPTDTEIVTQAALYFWQSKQRERALRVLRSNPGRRPQPSLSFLLAGILRDKGTAEEHGEAQTVLDAALPHLSLTSESQRIGIVEAACEGHTKAGRPDTAAHILTKYRDQLPPICFHTISAAIALSRGHSDAVRKEISGALGYVTASTPLQHLISLVFALRDSGDDAEALNLISRHVPDDRVSSCTRLAVDLASRAKDDGFILVLGEKLRARNIYDLQCVTEELRRLTHYNALDKALAVISESLSHATDELFKQALRLFQLQIGVLRARPDLICDLSSLPSAEEIRSEDLPKIVPFLVRAYGHPNVASYVYRALRERPSDVNVNKALILAVGLGDDAHSEFAVNPTVVLGTAVEYKNLIDGATRWCVIEDSPRTDQGVTEYAVDSHVGRQLIGKRVGDEFPLRRDDVQNVDGCILKIIRAEQFRAQDAATNWEIRFPEDHFLKKVVFQSSESAEPNFDILVKQVDARAQSVTELLAFYAENPVPVTMLAQAFDSTVVDALLHIASRDDGIVRCCRGTAEEAEQANRDLSAPRGIVVDEVALGTLFQLDAGRVLRLVKWPIFVTEGTINQFRYFRERLRNAGRATLSRVGARLLFHEPSSDEMALWSTRISVFIELLETHCTVVDGLALARMPAKERAKLTQLFGQSVAEATSAASDGQLLLWTDDFAISEVSRELCGVRRVWSEAVFRSLVRGRLIELAEYEAEVLSLHKRGYEFTPLYPNVVLAAAREAEWSPDHASFRRVVKWFRRSDREPRGVAQIVGSVLPRIWAEVPLYEARVALTRSLARAVLLHPAGRKILEAVLDAGGKLFGREAERMASCNRVIHDVLEIPDDGRLFVPS